MNDLFDAVRVRRAFALPAAAAAVALAAVGCGSSDSDTSSAAPTVVTQTVTRSVDDAAPSTPAEPADRKPSTPAQSPAASAADPSTYAMEKGHFFSSASSKWKCGIAYGKAGCHGPVPKSAPPSYGGQHPTGAEVGSGNAELVKFSSPEFMLQSGDLAPVLPYGQTLTADGFACSIAETSGVTCTNTATGHGFTVSDAAYRLF